MAMRTLQVIVFFYCAVVTVFGKNWQQIIVRPKSIEPSKTVTLFPGASLTLYCGTTSLANWTFFPLTDLFESPISSRHLKGYNNITLKDLKVEDTGSYYCHGTFGTEQFTKYTFVNVLIYHPDGAQTYVVPNWIEVPINGSVALYCGSLTPVEWISASFLSVPKSLVGNRLELYNLQKEHSGLYICRGTFKIPQFLIGLNYVINPINLFHSKAVIIVGGEILYSANYTTN